MSNSALESELRITIEEMLSSATIKELGCDNPDVNICVVRICGEVNRLEDRVSSLEQELQRCKNHIANLPLPPIQ